MSIGACVVGVAVGLSVLVSWRRDWFKALN